MARATAATSWADVSTLILHEVIGISALDAAIAAEDKPGYVVLFQDSKNEKQANVAQMATLLRMTGAAPSEAAAFQQMLQKARTGLAERIGGTAAALRTLRVAARELLESYADALRHSQGLTRSVLEKARARTTVQIVTLTAHIAQLTGQEADATKLPWPLTEYFAGPGVKVCMRCHFDRPGIRGALERKDEHPYTYICAGCHDDAVEDFRPDIASQMERWTQRAREARAIQHALSRPSKLMATHTVIRRLCGLPEDPPAIARDKPLSPPLPPPSPSPAAPRGVVHATSSDPADADYVAKLFEPEAIRKHW